MPITFSCTCGKTLRVNDDLAGKNARCPACQTVLPIPAPAADPGFEVVGDAAPPPPRRATPVLVKPAAKPAAPPPPPDAGFDVVDDGGDDKGYKPKGVDARRTEEDAAEEPRRTRRRRDDFDDEDEDDRVARRRPRARSSRPVVGWSRTSYVVTAVIFVAIGITLIVVGWNPDTSKRRPYKTLVAGIGCVAGGLMTGFRGPTADGDDD